MWEEGALMNASAIRHGTLRNLSQSDHFKDVPFPVSALPLPPPTQVFRHAEQTMTEEGSTLKAFNSAPVSRVGMCFLMGRGLPLWQHCARPIPRQCGWNRNYTSVGGRAEKEEGVSAEAESQ